MKTLDCENAGDGCACAAMSAQRSLISSYYLRTKVAELMHRAAAKSCPLDPMPTSVVLQVVDVLLPVISSLINLSF